MSNSQEQEVQIQEQKVNSKKSSLLNKLIKIVLPLCIGIFILYLLFRNTNFNELKKELRDVKYHILLFSLIFGLLGNTIRGFRWRLLIEPLGFKPKVANLCYAIYGNYAVNFAIPRGGEIWRCGIIAKEEKIPFPKLLETIIIDRVLDTFTVLIICILAFLSNMKMFATQIDVLKTKFVHLGQILESPYLYGGIVVVILVIIAILKYFKNNVIVRKIRSFSAEMIRDIHAISRMKTKNKLFIYTIGIWVCYFLYFYTTFYAFSFTAQLGLAAGIITFALSSLSMAVPTNGGIGAWQAAVMAALVMYGVSKTSASTFATAVFSVQSLWVIIYGLLGIVALSVRNRKNK